MYPIEAARWRRTLVLNFGLALRDRIEKSGQIPGRA